MSIKVNSIHIQFLTNQIAEKIKNSSGTKKNRVQFTEIEDKVHHYAVVLTSKLTEKKPKLNFIKKHFNVILRVKTSDGESGYITVNKNSLKKRFDLDSKELQKAIKDNKGDVTELVNDKMKALIESKKSPVSTQTDNKMSPQPVINENAPQATGASPDKQQQDSSPLSEELLETPPVTSPINENLEGEKSQPPIEKSPEKSPTQLVVPAPKVVKTPDPEPISLDYTFTTKLKGMEDSVAVMKKTSRSHYNVPIYQLCVGNRVVGEICCQKVKEASSWSGIKVEQCVFITYMKSFEEKKNVGRLLHEFAIRLSFNEGCEGRVALDAAHESDLFHFKCGFRYLRPLSWALGLLDEKDDWVHETQLEYQRKVDAGEEATAEFGELKEFVDRKPKRKEGITSIAKRRLEKDVVTEEEVILKGFYVDNNQSVADHLSGKKDRFFYCVGGPMQLCDEERAKWKEIIEKETASS